MENELDTIVASLAQKKEKRANPWITHRSINKLAHKTKIKSWAVHDSDTGEWVLDTLSFVVRKNNRPSTVGIVLNRKHGV